MNLKIVRYSPKLLPELITLIDGSFKIKNASKTRLVEWKFFGNRLEKGSVTFVALSEQKKVVGQYTNIPVLVSRKGKLHKAMICVDMTTAKTHRGLGLISLLSREVYKEVRSQNYEFSMGFSNDAGVKVDKNANNYGYVVVGKFVRFFKVIIRHKSQAWQFKKVSQFDKNFMTDLSSDFFGVYKDYSYLQWRYIEKPNAGKEYDIFELLGEEGLVGYVVLKFIGKKSYVYDLLVSNSQKDNLVKVLESIENISLKNGARLVVYNVLDNTFWDNLFNRYKYYKKVNNNVNYHLTVKIHRKGKNLNQLLDKNNWFLINGDIL